MAISRAFSYVYLGAPSEQGLMIKISILSLKFPGKGLPSSMFLRRGTNGGRRPFPDPSTHLSEALVEKLSKWLPVSQSLQ